jgi:AraC-like DNA-binding protein
VHAVATSNTVDSAHVEHGCKSLLRNHDVLNVTADFLRELEPYLSAIVQEVLTNLAFSYLRVEYEDTERPEKMASWSPNLGVSFLPSTSTLQVNTSLQQDARWTLRIFANFLPQWISSPEAQIELEILATQIGALLDSFLVRKQIRDSYQSFEHWFGYSKALRELEFKLRKLAQSQLPILLMGDKGTGKLTAALTVHCYRHALFAPFVHADCRNWAPNTAAAHLRTLSQDARGGSLYLSHADVLGDDDQAYLRDFSVSIDKTLVLLVGSRSNTQKAIQENSIASSFVEWFEFHGLSVHLPRLRERVQDIKSYCDQFLRYAKLELRMSHDAWELLENYAWPENGAQLQAVLRKAATLADGELNSCDLLQLFPSMKGQLLRPVTAALAESEFLEPIVGAPNSLEQRRSSIFAWLGLKQPASEHPALIRALEHIWKHYQQALTLTSVADKACVSSSHLSYLFKQRLQRSFKQIVTEIRIDKAKHIFENMPARQITQVCMDVGFADLSHFEKTFKRIVGLRPRCYRQQFRLPLSTQI